jgi:N-acetylneuraminate synthase
MTNTKFIAEIGSNGNSDIERIKKLIDSAYELGFYGIKFQAFKADTLYKDGKNKEILKDREFDLTLLPLISSYCKRIGLKIGITPFYLEGVDQVEPYIDFYKISSFDILRKDLIMACLSKKKPVYISCGLAEDQNISDIIKICNELRIEEEVCFQHCVSKYPTKIKDSCVSRIFEIDDLISKDLFSGMKMIGSEVKFSDDKNFSSVFMNVGYSDHSVSPEVVGQAINNGAEIIELHFDLDDRKGAETQYNHVWTESDCINLFCYLDQLEMINDGEFELTKDDLVLRADPVTGMRD